MSNTPEARPAQIPYAMASKIFKMMLRILCLLYY
jgi:hypothetical protein